MKQEFKFFIKVIILIIFSQNIKAQSINYSDKDQLKKGLLQSMNIYYDPFTTPEFEFEWKENRENYSIERFSIKKENYERIPGYLLKPHKKKPPYPVMICLQGHSPGMHISIGEARSERDSVSIAGGRDIAIQAINNGWAALVIEQKGFGERAVDGVNCNQLSLRELMAGNTMLGYRVSDVTMAINFINVQPDLDNNLIGCMGNSSGGTITYFAAAVDSRITLAVVSCSFSTYDSSWLKYKHCSCGFLPEILKVGDMPDFAALIAPRKLIIVAGKHDQIADIEGVREGFKNAKISYYDHGKTENIMLIEGEGGHQFYPELTWYGIQKIMNLN